jgi:NAD(P)-dependent dehydrogenase (short-subunit alcohol dehydrogenase family)
MKPPAFRASGLHRELSKGPNGQTGHPQDLTLGERRGALLPRYHRRDEEASMRDFAGKTAFVTGGASGIGLSLARALAREGAPVMLADIEADALERAAAELAGVGPKVGSVVCDVSLRSDVEAAAERTFSQFGSVHVLCNNAGVSRAGTVEVIAPTDWEWVIGVNLMGLIHGVQTFLPHMKQRGEGHIVNTASMAGLRGGALSGPYVATKFAVLGVSEVLVAELTGTGIGVTALCPASIHTRMPENGRNRPERFGGPFDLADDVGNAARNARYIAANETGLDPDVFAAMVLDAVRADQLYVFSHSDRRGDVDERFRRIIAAFDATERFEASYAASGGAR